MQSHSNGANHGKQLNDNNKNNSTSTDYSTLSQLTLLKHPTMPPRSPPAENSYGFLEMETVNPKKLSQSPVVQTSEVPPWVRLLTAPTCCCVLGLLLSPKFLVLAVVYGLTSLRPLYGCYINRQSNNSRRETNEDQKVRQQLDAALSLHRSLTVQFAMLAGCLWLYEHSRLLCMPKNNIDDADANSLVVHQAFDMAKKLVRWENAVGLAIEPPIQTFVLNHCHWLVALANTYYAILHFVAPLGVMARLIIFHKDPRYEYRVGFFIMLFFALLLFTFVPTMPPRLMPSYNLEYIETQQNTLTEDEAQLLAPYWSIVDTMKQGETLYDKLHKEGGNPYAAMPSMHTGWALWSCLTWIGTLDSSVEEQSRRYQKSLAIAHVVSMIFVIIVTGNHFWLDAAAGAACVMIGRLLATRFVRSLVTLSEGNGKVAHLMRRTGSLLASPAPTKTDDEELTQALTESPGSLSRASSECMESSASVFV